MRVRNFTAQQVNLLSPDGHLISSFPSEGVARVSANYTQTGTINGVPVVVPVYGGVDNLPLPEEGTVCIVSRMVAEAVPYRTDLVWPERTVREHGQIIGCCAWGKANDLT